MHYAPALLFFSLSSAFAGSHGKGGLPLTPSPDRFADRLTGDWGGSRATLADQGFSFDFDSTHYYQGIASGTGDHDFEYGGRLDGFVHLDSGRLGLWEGGGLHSHLEYRYGNLAGFKGGGLMAPNIGSGLPLGPGEELIASSIYFTQKFGGSVNFRIGRINTVDLLEADPFFGGYGIRRFSNLAFVAPPTGVTPPVIVGGILTFRSGPLTWTGMVYDPVDRTKDYVPDDLFGEGAVFGLSSSWSGKVAGRTSTATLGGIYSTKDGADFSELLIPDELKTSRKDGSYHISLQLGHFLHEDENHPGNGWGLFVKGGVTDGNPNPFQSYVTGGLGGKGLIPSRPRDNFGLGYFYYNYSDDLQNAVNPLIRFDDDQGMEVFYTFEITPWFHVTADIQILDPARKVNENAVICGLRANIVF